MIGHETLRRYDMTDAKARGFQHQDGTGKSVLRYPDETQDPIHLHHAHVDRARVWAHAASAAPEDQTHYRQYAHAMAGHHFEAAAKLHDQDANPQQSDLVDEAFWKAGMAHSERVKHHEDKAGPLAGSVLRPPIAIVQPPERRARRRSAPQSSADHPVIPHVLR